MKWTKTKVNKLTRNELISIIDKVEGVKTVSSNIPTNQLRNKIIDYINKGLI